MTKEATREELLEMLEDAAHQFGCQTQYRGWPALSTGGLSTLEDIFDALDWNDPHIVKGACCQIKGCRKWATCGTPTDDGYKRVCGDHMREIHRARQAP